MSVQWKGGSRWLVRGIGLGVLIILTVPDVHRWLWRQGWGELDLLMGAFLVSYLVVPLMRRIAYRVGAVDEPDDRKVHTTPTPLLGGGAIYSAFMLMLVLNWHSLGGTEVMGIALGATVIFGVGVFDDVRGLPAMVRLVAQVVAACIAMGGGVTVTFLPNEWGLWGVIGEWIITLIWFVGITNALNFMDGMDGLAAGTAGLNALFFSLIAWRNGEAGHLIILVSTVLLGACLGFLPYNFRRNRPALIFLGDGGSTFLGFVLAGIAVMGNWGEDQFVGIAIPLLVLGVPIFDMTLTTVMRIKDGYVRSFRQWIEFTGRDHFHHRLADLGIGKRAAVLVIYLVTTWLGLSAMVLDKARGVEAIFALLQSGIVFLLIAAFMIFVKEQYLRWAELVRETIGLSALHEEDALKEARKGDKERGRGGEGETSSHPLTRSHQKIEGA